MFYLVLLCALVKGLKQVVEEELMPFVRVHYGEPVVGGGPRRLFGGVSARHVDTTTAKIGDAESSGSEGYQTNEEGPPSMWAHSRALA